MLKSSKTLQAEASNDDQQKLLQTKTLFISDFVEITFCFILKDTHGNNGQTLKLAQLINSSKLRAQIDSKPSSCNGEHV